MRTNALVNVRDSISLCNNNLCFFMFVTEQFEGDSLASRLANQPAALFSSIFSTNQYASALNIRADAFAAAKENYRKAFFVSTYIYLYSVIEAYEEKVMELVRELGTISLENVRSTQAPNEKLDSLELSAAMLDEQSLSHLISPQLDSTRTYIRLTTRCITRA